MGLISAPNGNLMKTKYLGPTIYMDNTQDNFETLLRQLLENAMFDNFLTFFLTTLRQLRLNMVTT